jgi:hypothetical protein
MSIGLCSERSWARAAEEHAAGGLLLTETSQAKDFTDF